MKPPRFWYTKFPSIPALLLLPVMILFCLISRLRRFLYQMGVLKAYRAAVPVIVVGNIIVGGGGKTPFVLWLADFLKQQGFKPGIISRGYLSQVTRNNGAFLVRADAEPKEVGDEALLLAQRSTCPICISRRRFEAADLLMREQGCNIIISDDGLQHYALQRDVEIIMRDAARGEGNGLCLPAGPLRESPKRLREVDFVISKGASTEIDGFHMDYELLPLHNLAHPEQRLQLTALCRQKAHAIAAVAAPQSFFKLLHEQDIQIIPHAFPDHYAFKPADIDFKDELPVIMTEKDAVKCRAFARPEHWYLPVKACLPQSFSEHFMHLLNKRLSYGQKAA